MKAVFGKLVYLGDDNILPNAYVVFDGKTIAGVEMSKPECEIIGEYEVITPAFIDAHSHIGVERSGEPVEDSDTNEEMDSVLFDLNILDSIIMEDTAFRESIEAGVLYSCVNPGSGNIVGGRCAVVKNFSGNTRDAFIRHAGIKCAFGHNPKSSAEWKGTRVSTRMGVVALLRRELKKAKQMQSLVKRGKKEKEEFDPHFEFVSNLLARSNWLRVHVHKTDDIFAVLRLVDEFNLDIVIDHASDVHNKETFEALKRREIPVVYGPIDAYAYKTELKNETWRNARHLIDSKVKFCVMSDHPITVQRDLFLQLRHFRRFGLTKAQCISKITKEAAEILRVTDIGMLEKGRLASFVCWKGDPFCIDNYPLTVYAEGKQLFREQ